MIDHSRSHTLRLDAQQTECTIFAIPGTLPRVVHVIPSVLVAIMLVDVAPPTPTNRFEPFHATPYIPLFAVFTPKIPVLLKVHPERAYMSDDV
jgi:hypothetical protein